MKDVVDRLTPLGLVVLALLDEGDMHPYEMIRLMRIRKDDRLVSITPERCTTRSRASKRSASLAEVGVDRDGNRPERTTYTLTDPGRDAVIEWLRRELPRIDRPAEFRIALAEAHNLDRDEVVDLLASSTQGPRRCPRLPLRRPDEALAKDVPEQYLVEIERQTALLDAELAWLDDFIRRLDRHDLPWGATVQSSERYLAQREAARS